MMSRNNLITANFQVLINGKELDPSIKLAISSLSVEDEVNLPTMFNLVLNSFDFNKGDWCGIDLDLFKLGDEVKIRMGEDQTAEMLTGEITSIEADFGAESHFEIRGFDRLHRLRFGTKSRSFQEMKISEIVDQIASSAGLSTKIKATDTVQKYLFQNNQTDYDFLVEFAERLGYELAVTDKQLSFQPSRLGKGADVNLQYGVDFSRLTLVLNTLYQGSKVQVRGWDMKEQQEVTAEVGAGSEASLMGGEQSGFELTKAAFGDSPIKLVNETVHDSAEAEALAKAKYNQLLGEFIIGEGECNGNPFIRAGKNLGLKGIGSRFSGLYYVISSRHILDSSGYTTRFKLKRTGI